MAGLKSKNENAHKESQLNGRNETVLLNDPPSSSQKNKAATNSRLKEYTEYNEDLDLRLLLQVFTEVKNGNFSVRLLIDQIGMSGKIYNTLNEIISLNEKMMVGFTRAGNTIGKQGKLTQRIEVPKEPLPTLNVNPGLIKALFLTWFPMPLNIQRMANHQW